MSEDFSDALLVTILNWEKYNPRKDIKNSSWLRFQHDLFENWQFFDFDHGEIAFWVYLLCQASRRNEGGKVTVNFEHAHRTAKLCPTVIKSAIGKLVKNQVVTCRTLRGRYADVIDPYATRRDVTRRNGTERDVTEKKQRTFPSETSETKVRSTPKNLPDKITSGTSAAAASFCREYKRRYSVNYRITGKDLGIIKRLLSDMTPDVFNRLCAAYVDMPDPWFMTKRHDLATLEQNMAKVSHFEQSGKIVTQTQIRDVDRRVASQELLAAIDRGEV